jgi:hypothetical protein
VKKVVCAVGFLVLAAQLPLWGYDTSPSNIQVVPEAIWAAATGGGTWVTELQIVSLASTPADVIVFFCCSGYSTPTFQICYGLAQFYATRFSNILETLDLLDSGGRVYYGQVGTLYVSTIDANSRIQVQAKTVNGNYGKTFPGLNIVAGNTAAVGRPLVLLDLVRNATYRTFVGAYTPPSPTTSVVRFQIIDGNNVQVGSYFDKTFLPNTFMSFNPFTEAGVTSGNYENCYLLIDVLSGATDANGVMCFGSIANNYTNDTYALIARMYK